MLSVTVHTSQLLFVPMNMVLKRYLACQTFNKCQPCSNDSFLSKRTYIYKTDADNQLHNCIEKWIALYQDDRRQRYNYTCEITAKRTIELQLLR